MNYYVVFRMAWNLAQTYPSPLLCASAQDAQERANRWNDEHPGNAVVAVPERR